MADREKVLKGLECCCQMNGAVCRTECPYRDECIKNECVGTAHLCANALELLKEQPEIVRCKDCKNWIPGKIDLDNFEVPRCKRNVGIWTGDDFCSHAERKVNQDDCDNDN